MKYLFKSVFLYMFVISCAYAKDNNVLHHLQGRTMGTTYNIKYITSQSVLLNEEKLQANVDDILKEVNRQMSIFIKDSDISKFNNFKEINQDIEIPQDFAKVVLLAKEITQITEGKFDITIGPLVNLWGFGNTTRTGKIPSQETIDKIKQQVGFDKLIIKNIGTKVTLAKKHPDLSLDLGAIAKGFGVDKVSEYLESVNIKDYVVEIGGDLRVKGKNQNNDIWKIGIEKPQFIDPLISTGINNRITLPNLAIATSGDYRNYIRDKDNKIYSHEIDPITGKSIDNNILSISVIDQAAAKADALATGLFILGEKKALEISEKLHIPIYMILQNKGQETVQMSSDFKKFLQ